MLFTNSLVFAEQFGFNTNLLETNVLNLAVVVAVVVIYIGDALKSLLANRKQTILNNFQEADKRALEAESRLKEAQKQGVIPLKDPITGTLINSEPSYSRYIDRKEILHGKIDQMDRQEVMDEIKRIQSEFPQLVNHVESKAKSK